MENTMVDSDKAGNNAREKEDPGYKTVLKGNTIDKSRFGFQDIVKLVAGAEDDEQIFFVHYKLLTESSPFFKKALQGDWKEAAEQCVMLRSDLPLAVHAYVHFLYTGDMNIKLACASDTNNLIAAWEEQTLALQLYIFADKIQDNSAKNEAVRAMQKAVYEIRTNGKWHHPFNKIVHDIYSEMPSNCLMRKMIVDIYAYSVTTHSFLLSDVLPKAFYFDVAVASMKLRPGRCAGDPRTDITKYLEKA